VRGLGTSGRAGYESLRFGQARNATFSIPTVLRASNGNTSHGALLAVSLIFSNRLVRRPLFVIARTDGFTTKEKMEVKQRGRIHLASFELMVILLHLRE